MVQLKNLPCFAHMLTKLWHPMTAKEHQGKILSTSLCAEFDDVKVGSLYRPEACSFKVKSMEV